VAAKSAERIGVLFSPWMTVEEAYLLADWVTTMAPGAMLAVAPPRVVGHDDCYPKGRDGQPVEPIRFTIRAEKAPNREGVRRVVEWFAADATDLDGLLDAARAGKLDAALLVGGDPEGWLSESQSASLAPVAVLAVLDFLATPLSETAQYVLSGGSFAERDGTFVNHAGLAQEVRRSVRGPEGSRPDGRVLWDLTGRVGLFNAPALRSEIAERIPSLAALASGTLGDQGTFLTARQSAVPAAIE
jgi:NADH-quinone oxidoreductase subunit G